MEFFGREEEIKKLNRLFFDEKTNLCLIYGRRRVGKSELVKHVLSLSKQKSIYYECKQTTQSNNVSSISILLSEMMNLPKFDFNEFEDLLDYIFKLSLKEKIILVLDEYPYLKENIKGIDSIIQTLIDRYRDQSRLTLVLLGSYVEVMKSLIEHSNPLYGRVDLTINLKPMDYYESSMFYPNFSVEDKVRIYSVFGGIPYYNRLIDDKKTVKENIIELIASNSARLENEVSFYLKSEMSKMVNANETLETLAKGYSRYNDILSQSHVSSGPTLIDTLDKLIKMEIVKKVSPINDENNKRKTGYYIADQLSLFYYRYIYRHLSQLSIMDENVFYNKYIASDFEEKYVPLQLENIAKEYLIRKNRKGQIEPVIEKIGKYYYDDPKNRMNGEFDIVTLDEKGYVFYEVKFRKNVLPLQEVKKEIQQVSNTKLKCYKYVFITSSGIESDGMDNVEHLYLKDLYKDI